MAKFALTLLSAILYVATFPLPGFHHLAWVCLVPLFLALRDTTPATGLRLGGLWGTATIWGIGYWVPQALAVYWEQPVWFGLLLALIGSLVFMGSYGALFGWLAARLTRGRVGLPRMLLLSVAWITSEVARGRLLTGDPWLLLGYAGAPSPLLIQCADIGGVQLVSFLFVLANAGLAEVLTDRHHWRRALGVPALAVIACMSYGSLRLATLEPAARSVNVGIVQANTDYGAHWKDDTYGEGLAEHLELSRTLPEETELIVWPESALNVFVAHDAGYRGRIAALARERDAEIIAGAPHLDDRDPAVPRYFNSAFYFSADGQLADRYDKVHLLPFGEYFPLRTIGFLRRRFERVRTFTAATESKLLRTEAGNLVVAICFEAIFPELVGKRMRDADLLLNLSNDAWLGPNAGPEQHLQMVVFRAVENRTWVVRAAPTGVSAIIDPAGRIIDRLDSGTVGTLAGRVGLLRTSTAFEWMGDWFAYSCVVITLLCTLGFWMDKSLRP